MLSNVSLIRRIKLKNFSTNAKTKHFCLCAHKISFKQFTTNQPTNQFVYIAMKAKRFQFIFLFISSWTNHYISMNSSITRDKNQIILHWTKKINTVIVRERVPICNSGTHFDLQVNKKSANILLNFDSSWIDCISHEFTFNWTKASRIAFDIEYTNCSRSTGVKLWYCPLL